jgi:hypothetical protein
LFTGIGNHENIEINDNHTAKKDKKEVTQNVKKEVTQKVKKELTQKTKKESRKAVPEPNKEYDNGVRCCFGYYLNNIF